MDKKRLRTNLEQMRAALPTSTLTDEQLEGYSIVLRDINGNIVDKQPLSRVREMLGNYLAANAYLIGQAINNRTGENPNV